jgi:hypothetical protein
MRRQLIATSLTLILVVSLFALTAHAAAVGRFTLIKGQVDVLKNGKVPGIPAKVQDGVEPGDVIRTKSGAKAQLSMVDASVITLAPESRLAVADFHYDPAGGERRAVLRLFRGMVHTVVNRIIKTEEPDFLMETHTATIGVRGTDWYTLLSPNATGVYLPNGILSVSSNLPAVKGAIRLPSRHFTHVLQGLPPSLPQPLTPEILRILEKLMDTGLSEGGLGFGSPAAGTGALYKTPLTLPGSPDQKLLQQTIPPVLAPQHQIPAPVQPPSAPVQHGPSPGSPGPSPGPTP